MEKFERWVECSPAFDKRSDDPRKNYGIHGVELKFLLKGPLGVVQFVIYTNWHLPHVMSELDEKPCEIKSYGKSCYSKPLPADIGYHSPTPKYDGQSKVSESCEYLDGKPCYYDGSCLMAKDVFDVLLESGSDGIWKEMEKKYKDYLEMEEK